MILATMILDTSDISYYEQFVSRISQEANYRNCNFVNLRKEISSLDYVEMWISYKNIGSSLK